MSGAGTTHLLRRLALVEGRVRRAVEARRLGDPDPADPFRGLYLSDADAQRLLDDPPGTATPDRLDAEALAKTEAAADDDEANGAQLRLRGLARGFSLTDLDVEILLIALLPDVEARFERLYGYLNNDVTRQRPSVGLALELCGVPASSASGRARFAGSAPLIAGGLLLVEQPEAPYLSRHLRVPDRVTAYLLGDDAPDHRLADVTRPETVPTTVPGSVSGAARPGSGPVVGAAGSGSGPRAGGEETGSGAGADAGGETAGRLAAALRSGVRLAYLRERQGGRAEAVAVAGLAGAGWSVLRLDLTALTADPAPGEALAVAVREARLRGAGLVAGPVQALEPGTDPRHAALLRGLAEQPLPVLLTGDVVWDPHWTASVPLPVTVAPMSGSERAALWRAGATSGARRPAGWVDGVDAERELAPYVLGADHLHRAAQAADHLALLDGAERIDAGHLRGGVRAQNSAGLAALARHIEPAVGWDDLVLPEPVLAQLRELAVRVRHRDRVLGRWRMRPGGGRGRGVLALFAGDSGTGKTMSAEVVAADLGLDLYTVDLSTVVDKYVGQTEKNLERIFTEAAKVNGVLLFDEADAIFGKRSEVKDARDRYANLESAYLLQRMESFDGIAVLTTNLRSNLDEAFTRRLDLIIDFPVPDAAQRRALWDRCLGVRLPRDADLDLDFCANGFELAGGSIRSCTVSAAYLAAEAGRPVRTADLIEAVRQEYRKLGRLLLDSEFGDHLNGDPGGASGPGGPKEASGPGGPDSPGGPGGVSGTPPWQALR